MNDIKLSKENQQYIQNLKEQLLHKKAQYDQTISPITFYEYTGYDFDPKERSKIICQNLMLLRKEAGLTQKELASIMGIAPQTYNAYETGKNDPSVETLIRLAFLYRVSMDFITGRWEGIPEYQSQADYEEYENLHDNGALEELMVSVNLLKYEMENIKIELAQQKKKS